MFQRARVTVSVPGVQPGSTAMRELPYVHYAYMSRRHGLNISRQGVGVPEKLGRVHVQFAARCRTFMQVLFRRVLLHGDAFMAEDADVLLSEPLHRLQPENLHQKAAMKKALASSSTQLADKQAGRAADEYKRCG